MRAMTRSWIALLAAIALLCASAFAEAAPEPTGIPESTEASTGASTEAPQPAAGYVLVSTATQSGWLPLPEEGEYTFPLSQVLPDGTQALNVIHLTPEGVYMEDSTCQGHDCVEQGIVTLENRQERILGNMIICLPNQVCLQLFTPEEVLEMVGSDGTEGGMENGTEDSGEEDAP